MSLPRVLFVSKPIAAPFHDGTKCLVREVARELTRHQGVVMSTPDGPGFTARAGQMSFEAVYTKAGSYSPGHLDNARAALWLLLRSRADLWHFVFAPNPRTSTVGRIAKRLRRVPVVQTVASPPAKFDPQTLFGDVIVAQSAWTEERLVRVVRGRSNAPKVAVVPPPVGDVRSPPTAATDSVRQMLGLCPGQTTFVYPGDLEFSGGAEMVTRAVAPIAAALPDCIVVFACRAKTAQAPVVRRQLEARLPPDRVRFVESVDLIALLAICTAVLFPVDDLYGKVDLPISLLEAMQLGVPVLTWSYGPLAELEGALKIAPFDVPLLAEHAIQLARNEDLRLRTIAAQRRAIDTHYNATRVARAYEDIYAELLSGHDR